MRRSLAAGFGYRCAVCRKFPLLHGPHGRERLREARRFRLGMKQDEPKRYSRIGRHSTSKRSGFEPLISHKIDQNEPRFGTGTTENAFSTLKYYCGEYAPPISRGQQKRRRIYFVFDKEKYDRISHEGVGFM